MSYKLTTSIPVDEGGTGANTFTAYAVICGGTTATNPFQPVASVGTTGQILTSNGAAALPTFQAAPATSMVFQSLAADPGAPINSQVWYNTTSNEFKGYKNGATVVFDVTP